MTDVIANATETKSVFKNHLDIIGLSILPFGRFEK